MAELSWTTRASSPCVTWSSTFRVAADFTCLNNCRRDVCDWGRPLVPHQIHVSTALTVMLSQAPPPSLNPSFSPAFRAFQKPFP